MRPVPRRCGPSMLLIRTIDEEKPRLYWRVHKCCARGTAFHFETYFQSEDSKLGEWHTRCCISDQPHGFIGARQYFAFVSQKKTKKEQESFMAAKAQHEYAVYLFQQGFYEDA